MSCAPDRKSNPIRLPLGLVGMAVLIALIERSLVRHEFHVNPVIGWTWREAGRAAGRPAPARDVVCLGDSQVKHGMLARVLEARLGGRAANLAFSGGQAPSTYFQLRRILAAGNRPAALLVDFNPILLYHGLEENAYRWADYLSTPECLELAASAREPAFFAWVMATRLLPSLHYREGIRAAVPASLRGESRGTFEESRQVRRNVLVNKGAIVLPRNPRCYFVADLETWFRTAFHPEQVASRTNALYLDRFLALAAARGIPVYWVVPPNHPKIEARIDEGGYNARYTRLLEATLARYPNLVVLDGRHSGYPPDVFYDQGHLDRQGAASFSSDVAAVVARQRAGAIAPRRPVNLPAYREQSPPVLLEDLGESYVALNAPPASSSRRAGKGAETIATTRRRPPRRR